MLVRLIPRLMLVVAAAFVGPVALLGVASWRATQGIDERVSAQASQVVLRAEKERLAWVVRELALEIDRELQGWQAEVALLRHSLEYQLRVPSRSALDSGPYVGKDTAELPALGYVDQGTGCFADWDQRTDSSPWLPRSAVERVREEPVFRARMARRLRDLAWATPLLAGVRERHASEIDLAWIVLNEGLTNVQPPYDYRRVVAEDPGIITLNESEEDYVRLAAPELNPGRTTRWLPPYLDHFRGVWMTSCVAPLYADDQFEGSVGIDLLLPTITQRVVQLAPFEAGFAVMLDAEGRPIAIPDRAIDLLFGDPDSRSLIRRSVTSSRDGSWSPEDVAALRRLVLPSSDITAVRELGGALGQGQGTTGILLAEEAHLASFATVPLSGWRLAVPVKRA